MLFLSRKKGGDAESSGAEPDTVMSDGVTKSPADAGKKKKKKKKKKVSKEEKQRVSEGNCNGRVSDCGRVCLCVFGTYVANVYGYILCVV